MSSSKRDTLILVAVLVIVAGGYLIIKSPQSAPDPHEGHNHGQAGSMDEAMSSSMANFPTDYNSLVRLGNETMDQRNFPVAAEAYRRAMLIDGSNNDVRTDYGACLHGMGLPKRAIDEFQIVAANDPRHVVAKFNIGIVYYSLKQVDSARAYWNEVLTLEPEGNVAEMVRDYLKQINN